MLCDTIVMLHLNTYFFSVVCLLLFFVFSKRAFKSFPELKDAVWDQYSTWTNRFGVLLFLYSVILTKVCGLLDVFCGWVLFLCKR